MSRQLLRRADPLPEHRPMRPRLWFVVESATDVRLVEGLAADFQLTVITRRMGKRMGVSQTPSTPVSIVVGPAGRGRFARFVTGELLRHRADIDVVLVQGYSIAALAANLVGRLAHLVPIMLVCSPTEAYYRCRRVAANSSSAFRWHELVGLQALARLNALVGHRYVVLSHHLADVVGRHGRRLPVSVIPLYGVDAERFSPSNEPRAAIRERLSLPGDGSLLFFSSRIAPEKDADTLLAALRLLADRGHLVRLLHRSGGYREFLSRAAAMGVESLVFATDAVHPHNELPDSYRACELCVQASREEGLGFSALEALACEVPVVAAGVGGLLETVIEGETGWTYPRGDADALALQIVNVLTHPVEAQRRARAGRELVLDRYERAVVFDRFARLVRDLCASGSGSGLGRVPTMRSS
jgi:glycosyltransferase involved in cell wall biosynthesis